MRAPRPPRNRQRGNSMLVALIVLSSLAALGSLTVISIQSSLKASTNDRASTIAVYAAESGAAMAIQRLRQVFDPVKGWTDQLDSSDTRRLIALAGIAANGKLPGDPANPFALDQNAWFQIEIRNNRTDPFFFTSPPALPQPHADSDGQVVVRVTGHGPQNSMAIIEWEIARYSAPTPGPPVVGPWLPQPASDPVVIVSETSIL